MGGENTGHRLGHIGVVSEHPAVLDLPSPHFQVPLRFYRGYEDLGDGVTKKWFFNGKKTKNPTHAWGGFLNGWKEESDGSGCFPSASHRPKNFPKT